MVENKGRIVIVGAGSTGSSVAYHIAKRVGTGKNVVIIDRSGIAAGMTSLSTAIVRTHYSNEIVAKMALYSMNVLKDFQQIGYSGFTKTGMMFLFSRKYRRDVQQRVQMLRDIGVKEEFMDVDEAKSLFPYVDFDSDIDSVVFEPDSGYADPVSTTSGYARKAMELGASFLKDSVSKIKTSSGGGGVLLMESGKEIRFDKCVICTNVWTNKLLEQSECSPLPLKVTLHPVVVYNRPEKYSGTRPIVSDIVQGAYFKPEGMSLLSGGTHDPHMDSQSIDPYKVPADVPFEYILDYTEKITRRIPLMKEGTFRTSYYGMYDVSPDEHPIIDKLDSLGLKDVYCCVGLSGHGFKLSPALGLITSEMVLDEAYSRFDGSIFQLKRFGKEGTIFKRYEGVGTIA